MATKKEDKKDISQDVVKVDKSLYTEGTLTLEKIKEGFNQYYDAINICKFIDYTLSYKVGEGDVTYVIFADTIDGGSRNFIGLPVNQPIITFSENKLPTSEQRQARWRTIKEYVGETINGNMLTYVDDINKDE